MIGNVYSKIVGVYIVFFTPKCTKKQKLDVDTFIPSVCNAIQRFVHDGDESYHIEEFHK